MSSESGPRQEHASVPQPAEAGPLNSLCHKFYPAMLAIARKHIGSQLKTRVDVQDIVQTAFREVLQRDEDYEDELHFRRVLVTGVRRSLVTLARHDRAHKRARHRETSHSDLDQSCPSVEPIDASPLPLDVAIAQEEWSSLRAAIAALPLSQRLVLMVPDRDDEPRAGAARRLGKSEETLRRAYWRAVVRLRGRLTSWEDDCES
jgi:RNA polymerase sigma factor (sigma-70 family)